VIDRILKRGDHLAIFPRLGRLVDRYRRPGIREVVEAPYRIVYRVQRESVEVIEVFHSAQLPPWER
jgi:plasmid stabilization system protein ParE